MDKLKYMNDLYVIMDTEAKVIAVGNYEDCYLMPINSTGNSRILTYKYKYKAKETIKRYKLNRNMNVNNRYNKLKLEAVLVQFTLRVL